MLLSKKNQGRPAAAAAAAAAAVAVAAAADCCGSTTNANYPTAGAQTPRLTLGPAPSEART